MSSTFWKRILSEFHFNKVTSPYSIFPTRNYFCCKRPTTNRIIGFILFCWRILLSGINLCAESRVMNWKRVKLFDSSRLVSLVFISQPIGSLHLGIHMGQIWQHKTHDLVTIPDTFDLGSGCLNDLIYLFVWHEMKKKLMKQQASKSVPDQRLSSSNKRYLWWNLVQDRQTTIKRS
jgi:hypothetical protein